MNEKTVIKLVEIDETIRYWNRELEIIKGRSRYSYGQIIFCDDFSKVNGNYARAHIPARVALELVTQEVEKYIASLKKERVNVEKGKKSVLQIIKGYLTN